MERRDEEKWALLGKDKKYSDDGLMKHLTESERGIAVLDGYSGCGKTMLLRRIKKELPDKIRIYSDEKLIDMLMAADFCHPKAGSELEKLLGCRNQIICIEDVDLYEGRCATQMEISEFVGRIAEENLVILTGNYMHKRIPELMEMLEDEKRHAEVWHTEKA